MGIIDDILRKNADDRLAEEMLYAEAIREIEQGVRRDGLWGKALADSEGDEKKAKYINRLLTDLLNNHFFLIWL